MRVTKAIKAEQLKLLQEHYFDAKPALEYTNEFELLVAVVLSAQCTEDVYKRQDYGGSHCRT